MPPRLIGAGVIPFYRSASGEPLFVFCREGAQHCWRASLKLSAFGGAAKACETASETAVRELCEESLHAFPTQGLDHELTCGQYTLRVVVETRRFGAVLHHVTFVREIPPDETGWRQRFEAVRQRQLAVQRMLREWYTLLEWLSAAVPASLRLVSLAEGYVEVRFDGPLLYTRLSASPAEETMCDTRNVTPRVCRAYVRWCTLGRMLHEHRLHMNRQCPGIFRSEGRDGFALDESYLETDAVIAWSHTELASALREGYAPSVFRQELLPILQVLVDEFAPRDGLRPNGQ